MIKNSLENISPEVPEHLWQNIKANIPQPQGQQPSTDATQGGTGSVAGGGSAIIKLGIAAAVLVGGGALVWHLATNEPAEHTIAQQPVEQVKETAVFSEEDQDITASEQEFGAEADNSNEITPRQEQAPPTEPVDNDATRHIGTTEQENEPTDNTDVADENFNNLASGDDDSAGEETEGEESASEGMGDPVVDDGDDETTVEGNDHSAPSRDDFSDDEDSPEPTPFIVVEAGILANKVSGEAPMSVQFSNLTQARSYEWDFGNGRKSFDPAPMTTFDQEGEYTVQLTVTDFDGNQLRDQMVITVFEPSTFFVPNAFSPNGDGANDYFMVEGTNVTDVKFAIYRLDGSLVYEGFGFEAKWDGVDPHDPLGDKYHVVATAIKANGEPVQKRVVLTILRDL